MKIYLAEPEGGGRRGNRRFLYPTIYGGEPETLLS